jgi:DNA-binding transcriptional MocR family regulator
MKHKYTSQLLERRIRHGDYLLSGIPAERELAGEIGVSRVTIRRALEELRRKGLIERLPNRRVALSRKARSSMGDLQLAFLAPSNGPAMGRGRRIPDTPSRRADSCRQLSPLGRCGHFRGVKVV